MKLPTADRAAAAIVRKPNGVFRVHYENGYPQAIMLGKVLVIPLFDRDCRTMACIEPLVARLNAGNLLECGLRELAEQWAQVREDTRDRLGWIKRGAGKGLCLVKARDGVAGARWSEADSRYCAIIGEEVGKL